MLCSAAGHAQEIKVTGAKAGGVYAIGEKIVWHLKVEGDGAQNVEKVGYVLKKGQLTEIGRGELTLHDNAAELETQLDKAGSVLAEFTAKIADKKPLKILAGVIVAPEKIQPSAPAPDDFGAFWEAKIAELATVPPNPVLERGESGNDAVEYAKITLDNIRGTKIRGQIARPVKGDKFPAVLIVQWAGVYGLNKDWVTQQARQGRLALNLNAHDLPIDEKPEFYQEQSNTDLKNYPTIGNEDRETSYFLRMILSCYRAADYLASRQDWDGKNLIVMGTSQGGMQSIMLAGLHPKISAMVANVPAGCDQTGPLVGRQPGWPQWIYNVQGKDKDKVMATSRYFDTVNFARRVKCPALVAVGLIDETCPSHGVLAAFNQMPGPKELLVMEHSDHQGRDNSQAAYYRRSSQWLQQIIAGETP